MMSCCNSLSRFSIVECKQILHGGEWIDGYMNQEMYIREGAQDYEAGDPSLVRASPPAG